MATTKTAANRSAPITFVIPGEMVAAAGTRGGLTGPALQPSMDLRGRVKASVRVRLRRADGSAQGVQAQRRGRGGAALG